MINKKILLSIAVISLLYTGCNEQETKQNDTPIIEKKSEAIIKKVEKVEQKEITKTVIAEVKTKIVEVTAPIIKSVEKITLAPDAKLLYKRCSGCHGINGEKKALGKSEIIQKWDATQIVNALKGFQSETYKGIMKSQVASLTEKEIDALSKHISTLK